MFNGLLAACATRDVVLLADYKTLSDKLQPNNKPLQLTKAHGLAFKELIARIQGLNLTDKVFNVIVYLALKREYQSKRYQDKPYSPVSFANAFNQHYKYFLNQKNAKHQRKDYPRLLNYDIPKISESYLHLINDCTPQAMYNACNDIGISGVIFTLSDNLDKKRNNIELRFKNETDYYNYVFDYLGLYFDQNLETYKKSSFNLYDTLKGVMFRTAAVDRGNTLYYNVKTRHGDIIRVNFAEDVCYYINKFLIKYAKENS